MDLLPHHEAVLQDKLMRFLGKWFDVCMEVTSDCSSGRIDLLMYHRTDKYQQFPIGIEIKPHLFKKGTEVGAWCRQAQRYTECTFDTKTATIFTAPQISGFYLKEGSMMNQHKVEEAGDLGRHYNVNPFLYRSFGIGELQKYEQKQKYRIRGTHYRLVINCKEIWTSEDGYQFNYALIQSL
jgi:hypothetical protein